MWLWQRGEDAGYALLIGRRTVSEHAWTTVPDSAGDAAALAHWADRPDLEVPLRALLRRHDPEVIPDLVAILDLPPAVPDVLAGRTELAALPGVRWREKESAWSLATTEQREKVANQASWVHRTWLTVAVLAAGLGAVLAVVEVAALAGVDAAGEGSVLSLLRFAGFAGLMTWFAARRYRRLRG